MRADDLQIAALPGDRCLVRSARGAIVLGVDAAELRRALDLAAGRPTEDEILSAMPPELAQRVGELLPHLLPGSPRRVSSRVSSAASAENRVEALPGARRLRFFGNGPLVATLAERLGADAETIVEKTESAAAIERLTAHVELAVCAFDDVGYGDLFELQRAFLETGTPSLFLTSDPDALRLGPLTVGGVSACLACAQLAGLRFLDLEPERLLEAMTCFRTTRADRAMRELAAALLARQLAAGEARLATEMLLVPAVDRELGRYPVERQSGCPLCDRYAVPNASETARGGALARRVEAAWVARSERAPRRAAYRLEAKDEPVRRVGILGGGTAGYLTALALARRLPWLAVTLIESSAIPIIGVGEATTPLLPQFLHADLGLDVDELFAAVEPTLKLGIRFEWGRPEIDHFNYPFGPVRVLEPQLYDGDVRRASLRSLLMSAGTVPVYAGGDELEAPFDAAVAYHLENRRFAAYLRRQALGAGVERVDAAIAHAELDAGGEVRALVAEDGRRFRFDLYVDCSGFRSLLMGKALDSPFVSYAHSLPADAAVVAAVPHHGRIQPYTRAETLSSGWCWSTPMRDADHRGYVFASDFLTPAAAEAEMRRLNPGMGEARLVRFRAGRRRHFWRRNVVAMGNAYGFVEPLESTALHMLVRQIGALLEAFPLRRGESGVAEIHNRRLGAAWDYLAWFLALHYRFNGRLDTPFWRHCRAAVDVEAHGELIAAFRERGPLSYDRSALVAFDYPDPLWGAEGIDLLLLGQGVRCDLPGPVTSRARWEESQRLAAALVHRALPQARALAALDRRPRLRDRLADAFRRAGPAFRVEVAAPPV